jgi:hypothetical protein
LARDFANVKKKASTRKYMAVRKNTTGFKMRFTRNLRVTKARTLLRFHPPFKPIKDEEDWNHLPKAYSTEHSTAFSAPADQVEHQTDDRTQRHLRSFEQLLTPHEYPFAPAKTSVPVAKSLAEQARLRTSEQEGNVAKAASPLRRSKSDNDSKLSLKSSAHFHPLCGLALSPRSVRFTVRLSSFAIVAAERPISPSRELFLFLGSPRWILAGGPSLLHLDPQPYKAAAAQLPSIRSRNALPELIGQASGRWSYI